MTRSTSSIPRHIRWRVFRRSLFLQASWNPKGMQNLGLAWAVYPALCWLYPAKEARQAAVLRHLSPFNTHPYVAAAIVGGVLYSYLREPLGDPLAFAGAWQGWIVSILGAMLVIGIYVGFSRRRSTYYY